MRRAMLFDDFQDKASTRRHEEHEGNPQAHSGTPANVINGSVVVSCLRVFVLKLLTFL
jgi:hypothetical protein